MERPSGFQTAFRGFGQKENWGRKLSEESFLPQTPSFKDFRRYRIPLHSFSYFDSIRLSAGFFCGQRNADSIRPVFEDRGFYAVSIPDKKARPIIQLGLPFPENCEQGFNKGESLGRERGGDVGKERGKLSPESFPLSSPTFTVLESLFLHPHDEVGDAVGVAPFVVVPRDNLGELSVLHGGVLGFDDGGVRVALEIH